MRVLLSLLVGGLALSFSGCPADVGGTFDPNDPRLDEARLEIVGPSTFNLQYGEMADLQVRYVFGDGSPIPDAPIDFAMDASSGGSNLSARQIATDDAGGATVRVNTGDMDANFSVTATPPRGNDVTFRISVSEDPQGSISIMMRYGGEEDFDRYTPYLFRATTCADLNPSSLPTAERIGSPVSSIFDRPSFVGVPAGNDWVVAIVADIAGDPAGFGCTIGVEVVARMETVVDVEILDITPTVIFEGTYDIANVFDFGEGLPGSVNTALEVLDELTDDNDIEGSAATGDWGQDPGAFVVASVMELTCRWDCTLSGPDRCTHPLGDMEMVYRENFCDWSGAESVLPFGGCCGWELGAIAAQNFINDQIGTFVPEIVLRFLDSAGDLARAITQSRIRSVMMLQPADEFGMIAMDHRLLIMEVSLRDLGGMEHFVEFNLRDAGLGEVATTARASVRGDTLFIPSHSFNLNLGQLVQYIYLEQLLPLFGFESTAEMLEDWIDCAAVATAVHGAIGGVTDRLTEAQYAMYCGLGLTAAGDLVDNNIAGFIDTAAILTIAGEVVGKQVSTEGIAQELGDMEEPGRWNGSWDEAGMGDSIEGTFIGRRR